MRAAGFTIAFLLALAATASAQGGGKLNWKGKEDPKTAMLDARDQGKPIMLYFRAASSAPCVKLEEGAFSNPGVVEASRDVACIMVDIERGDKHKDLISKYGVTHVPTLVICDPQGAVLGRMTEREPDDVAKGLKTLGETVGAKAPVPIPMIVGSGVEQGLAQAKRSGRLLFLYFADLSPACLSMTETVVDPLLKDLLPKFATGKVDYVKGSAECEKFGVTRAPTILVLDCRLAKPEEKPIARIEGSRSPRELRRELEAALVGRDPGGKPAVGPPGELPSVPRDPPPPQEKLSDDVIERQFIWARVAVAQETLKRGSKDKAIEILEDVLKSYPKHKDTEEVRKVLEAMRK